MKTLTAEQKKAFEEKLNAEKRKMARISLEGHSYKEIANNLADLCSEILSIVKKEN